tara:strand:+ start:424 stop:648 length:225 start_codon:yes stop_codon:yes gene_type:complete
MSIQEIKERTKKTAPYFFSDDTLQFFGQKLTDFKVEEEADGRYRLWARCKNAPHKEPYFTVRYFNPLNNELENE